MQYMLMIYDDEVEEAAMADEEINAMVAAHTALPGNGGPRGASSPAIGCSHPPPLRRSGLSTERSS